MYTLEYFLHQIYKFEKFYTSWVLLLVAKLSRLTVQNLTGVNLTKSGRKPPPIVTEDWLHSL